jgi:hypothetical protein
VAAAARHAGIGAFRRRIRHEGKRTMTLALHPLEDGGGREGFSRLLAVTGALYGLLAAITLAVAALGLFGLFGNPVDAAAAEPAKLLGLPWSLALGAAGNAGPAVTLLATAGALAVNGSLLGLAVRLLRTPARRV